MQKVAIVGSNSFIGRHFVKRLQNEKNVSVALYGRSIESAVLGVPYKRVNLFSKDEISGSFEEADVIYYLASETIPASSWQNPYLEIEKNLTPFINLLEYASPRVKKVVFISSAGTVYGKTNGKVKEDSDKKPFSPYGIMKLTMENFLEYYSIREGMKYDVYRLSNVYGEGQVTSKGLGLINTFLENILTKGEVTVFGDGNVTRNYIYAEDVAELMTLSLRNSDNGIFNISSNDTLTINQIVEILKKVVPQEFRVNHIPARPSDNSFIDLDNSRICKAYGNFKFTSIEEGIQKTFLFLKQQVKNI